MYESYPSSSPELPEQGRPEAPNSVRNAVRLMYAGAALSAIVVIVTLVSIGSLKANILAHYPHYTVTQRHTAEVAAVVTSIIGGLIAIGLWLWMAWANGRGRNWARIVAAVFFGINTLDLLASFARVHAVGSLIVSVLVWLVGLGAIVFLFNKESAAYFKPRSAPR
jgi:predicted membrane-bound spermidine synthase